MDYERRHRRDGVAGRAGATAGARAAAPTDLPAHLQPLQHQGQGLYGLGRQPLQPLAHAQPSAMAAGTDRGGPHQRYSTPIPRVSVVRSAAGASSSSGVTSGQLAAGAAAAAHAAAASVAASASGRSRLGGPADPVGSSGRKRGPGPWESPGDSAEWQQLQQQLEELKVQLHRLQARLAKEQKLHLETKAQATRQFQLLGQKCIRNEELSRVNDEKLRSLINEVRPEALQAAAEKLSAINWKDAPAAETAARAIVAGLELELSVSQAMAAAQHYEHGGNGLNVTILHIGKERLDRRNEKMENALARMCQRLREQNEEASANYRRAEASEEAEIRAKQELRQEVERANLFEQRAAESQRQAADVEEQLRELSVGVDEQARTTAPALRLLARFLRAEASNKSLRRQLENQAVETRSLQQQKQSLQQQLSNTVHAENLQLMQQVQNLQQELTHTRQELTDAVNDGKRLFNETEPYLLSNVLSLRQRLTRAEAAPLAAALAKLTGVEENQEAMQLGVFNPTEAVYKIKDSQQCIHFYPTTAYHFESLSAVTLNAAAGVLQTTEGSRCFVRSVVDHLQLRPLGTAESPEVAAAAEDLRLLQRQLANPMAALLPEDDEYFDKATTAQDKLAKLTQRAATAQERLHRATTIPFVCVPLHDTNTTE